MDLIINVIGAGLAGSEAALQLAKRGIKVLQVRPTTHNHYKNYFFL